MDHGAMFSCLLKVVLCRYATVSARSKFGKRNTAIMLYSSFPSGTNTNIRPTRVSS